MILELLYLTGWVTLGLIIGDSLSKQTDRNLEKTNIDINKVYGSALRTKLYKIDYPIAAKCHTKLEVTNCCGETTTAEVGEIWYCNLYATDGDIMDINTKYFVRLVHEDDINVNNPEIMFWLNKEDVKNNFN